jgi:murein DD-endopeptidase MepM/ murein hydrolase activator NlpD
MMKHVLSSCLLLLSLASAKGAVALELKGVWQQGAIIYGQVAPGMKVEFQGRNLRLTEDGQFVLGLGRDAVKTATITTLNTAGQQQVYTYAVKQRKYQIQKVTGVPQATVTPDPEQVERSRREAQMAADARKGDLPLAGFMQAFQWPIVGRISGVYGSQRFYNGVAGSPHYGVDVARPTGSLVSAPASGQVTLVHPDMFFSGGTLIIDHGHGISSTFIHLSKILVKEGDVIRQGQAIAKVGQTGRATGPHLDWRMNWFEERLDPQLLVGPMPAY